MVAAATAPLPAGATGAGDAVEIRGVSHAFRLRGEPLPVLDRVDFRVEPGELVALVGPSGCGKSTLLRLLAGLDTPARGSVWAGGRVVSGPDPSRVLVFQDPTLYPWRTVRDNVALGPHARGELKGARARVDDALRLVGLEAFSSAYPHQLSGGMAQRAALARALVNDPRVLLLDEPLGMLDSLTRVAMQDEILALWRRAGFTALLVTHDVEEALLMASRVLVFSSRPARVEAVVPVELAYPRDRADPRFTRLRRDVLDLCMRASRARSPA